MTAATAHVRNFKSTSVAAVAAAQIVLKHWLPDGKQQGSEYVALNPTRVDNNLGSFRVNTTTGQWADFATDDKGGDLISLVAYLDVCGQGEAEGRLADFLGCKSGNRVTDVTCVTKKRNGKKKGTLATTENVTKSSKVARDTRDIQPIPETVPPPTFNHYKHGAPAQRWAYHNVDGQPLFHVCRFDTARGKQILPRTYDGKAWQWKGMPPPRPLYNLHHLAARPDAPVLVTEGEKAADAAAGLFPDCVTTTTPNGAKAANKADLSPLKGRAVLIWPDNDKQGAEYAETMAGLAHMAGATSVKVLRLDKLPGELPPKGDAADVVGWIPETGWALLADTDAWQEIAPAPTMPDRFALDTNGVYFSGIDKDGDALPTEWICSPLRITAMTRDVDGNAWGRLLEFTDQDNQPHRWAMPQELLAGDGSEYRRALLSMGLEIAPSSRARQRLTEYIQTTPVKIRARCVQKTGWHSGVFVTPDCTYGETSEKVLLQSLHEPAAMRTAGSLEEWRGTVAALCIGNSRLILAVSAAFAAPLLDITGDDSGGINLQGASSTGKTTALNAAVSVWGGPDYLQRWRATTNGLEATAQAHNDVLLCLDELAQVEAKEAGGVAYMLANGSGKQRARRDGLAKPKSTWRMLFLSAGEIGLAQHMREAGQKARAGQEVRLADIPADAGAGYGLFENLHGYPNGAALSDAIRDAARTQYGTSAREYLKELVSIDRDELRERLHIWRQDFSAEALPGNADGQAQRVCDRFALIGAGGELATRLGLTGWEPGTATQAAGTCFQAWLDHRGGAGAQEEKIALSQVQAFFEAYGESRFSWLNGKDNRLTISRAGFKRISKEGTAEYFILPEVWKSDVCAGLDPKYVARICVEHRLIKPDSEGSATSSHRLAEMGKRRVYHFIRIDSADNAN